MARSSTSTTQTHKHTNQKGKSKEKVKKLSLKADLRQRTYHSWYSMLQRCYNLDHVSYREYGQRGISVCNEWRAQAPPLNLTHMQAFHNFLRDVGIKPSKVHTLDRLKANLNYTPDNVKWSTPKEQGVNKRDTHFIRHTKTGVRVAAATHADELGITYQTLRAKLMKAGTWYELTLTSTSTEVLTPRKESP